jgi:hypothetical protein
MESIPFFLLSAFFGWLAYKSFKSLKQVKTYKQKDRKGVYFNPISGVNTGNFNSPNSSRGRDLTSEKPNYKLNQELFDTFESSIEKQIKSQWK